jgi:uncharacterized protein with PQ loop repeat
MDVFQKVSTTVGTLGFVPWIVTSIKTPETQSLSAWLCWTIISIAIAVSRKTQGQNFALWAVWAIGDVTVLASALWFGGNNWALEQNLPLMVAALIALVLALKLEGKNARFSEIMGSLALLMGHVIMWIDQWALPGVGLFFLISPIAGLVSPMADALREWKRWEGLTAWKRLRKLNFSTGMAVVVGVVLLGLMAT